MMRRRSRAATLGLAAAAAIAAVLVAHAQTAPQRAPVAGAAPVVPPRLVVLLVIDQFRSDYPTMYGTQWSRGLRRLFKEGATFPLAAYPYGGTVTCPGHFSIGTGSVPATHGMVSNTIFNRAQGRTTGCVTDATATSVPFGGAEGRENHSPRSLLVPTLADELRAQMRNPPRVVSVSLKPRSAIGLAGHGGPETIVVWEEDHGTWATSDAFARTPWPEVDAYVRAHPMAAAYGTEWTRLRPAGSYWFADDAPGEASPAPWGRTFPHKFETRSGQPDATFVSMWERSPHSDEFIAGLVMSLVQRHRLGQRGTTDFLAVSFSALDLVSHEYGPRSHETQDILMRLDDHIGDLLELLDRQVGPGRYTLGMSADHGVAPLPEQSVAAGLDAGRISSTEVRAIAQATIAQILGDGTFVSTLAEQNLFLRPGVIDRLRGQPGAVETVQRALTALPGIRRVYTPDELEGSGPTVDPFLHAWRLSYMRGRSGDFIVLPRPYWIIDSAGTTHGVPYGYDQRVPVVLFGSGIKPGEYLVPATPIDLAPTLAFLTGVTLAHADGRVLVEAIVRRP